MEKGQNGKNRVEYLDILRVLVTFLVIFLHVAASNWAAVPLDSYEWKVFNIFDGMVRWAVPIFIMISGALFLHPDKRVSTRSLYGKNILRMVTAYLFWAVLYAVDGYFDGAQSVKDAILAVIHGHYHLWFLKAIILLYAMIPLLRKITVSRKATEYFLLLSIAVGFIIPRIFYLLECLQLPYFADLLQATKTAFLTMQSSLGFGLLPYLVLGHYLATYEIKPRWRAACYLLGALAPIAVIGLTDWYSGVKGSANEGFYSYLAVSVLLTATAVFLFFRQFSKKHPLKERSSKWVARLSGYTFGVYLIHPFVLKYFCRITGMTTLTGDPILSLFVIVAAVSILSFLLSALLHQIPWLKKYIL